MERDFPNGLVVENMVANAGVTGLVPLGRSHMLWSSRTCVPKLLSLCSRAHKLQLLNHTLQQKKPLQRETHTLQLEKSPQAAMKTLCSHN